MDNGIHNLDKLTDQIYREGIERAEKQSKIIIQEVENNKEKILQDARDEAAKIVSEARREADRLKRSVENELALKGEQFISDLKARILDMLSDKIIKPNTEKVFTDVKFVQSMITGIIKNLKIDGELEVVFPADLEKKLKQSLANSIREMAPNLTISFGDKVDSGFRIARKSDNYQLSFGNEDFIGIFRPYLSEQADKLLFK